MTTPYATPHLDGLASAYRHHLTDNLATNWRTLLDGACGLGVVGAASWGAYHLDEFAGTAMVGVLIVMAASLASDFIAWPVYEALRSQSWYGPDRIVHRDEVGPVQVLDVDAREELGPLLWVLVRRIDSPDAIATWAPLSELAPSPEVLTSQDEDGEVER